jgi:nucleoside 2-deoxyribosyltransferase
MERDVTKKMTIYLAGTINNPWREKVKERFKDFDVEFVDPIEIAGLATGVFVEQQLWGATTCDVCLAYISADDPSGVGTMAEMTMAFNANKPIFLAHEGAAPHAFMIWMAHIFRTNLDCCLDSLEMFLINNRGYIYEGSRNKCSCRQNNP